MAEARQNVVATAEIDIAAEPSQVWKGLTDPDVIARYMFGSRVETDWQPGHPITWKGEYEGKPYEDKGQVVEVDEGRRLVVTHFSPMSGQPDVPESYHTVAYSLLARDGGTHVSLSQDNNGDEEEAARARTTWEAMLAGLKETVEAM